MTEFNIVISSIAKRDILDIYKYISETLHSEESALRLIQKIEESIRNLILMPERFRRYKGQSLSSKNIRICPVKNYLIFYQVDNEKKLVEIIRVLYSKRNYEEFV